MDSVSGSGRGSGAWCVSLSSVPENASGSGPGSCAALADEAAGSAAVSAPSVPAPAAVCPVSDCGGGLATLVVALAVAVVGLWVGLVVALAVAVVGLWVGLVVALAVAVVMAGSGRASSPEDARRVSGVGL